MTKQAIALGLLPRMRVLHTSESEIGQIYIPAVNWLQLIVVLIAVIGFGSSDKLAGAYGRQEGLYVSLPRAGSKDRSYRHQRR